MRCSAYGVHFALRPVCSLSHPKGSPFASECFRPSRYLHDPLRRLPAGATVSRAGFAPAGSQCLCTAHLTSCVIAYTNPVCPLACRTPLLTSPQRRTLKSPAGSTTWRRMRAGLAWGWITTPPNSRWKRCGAGGAKWGRQLSGDRASAGDMRRGAAPTAAVAACGSWSCNAWPTSSGYSRGWSSG